MEYYLAFKKEEILFFTTAWMNTLSEISQLQKDRYYRIHLYIESKTVELIEAESKMVVTRDWRVIGKRQQNIRRNKFRDLLFSMGIIVNNDIFYTLNLLKE